MNGSLERENEPYEAHATEDGAKRAAKMAWLPMLGA